MNLVDARQTYADALTAIDGLTVRARPPVKTPRPGDGWVVVQRIAPSDFRRSSATLVAVLTLGQDVAASEDLLDALAVAAVDVASVIPGLPTSDVVLETSSLVLDGGGPPLNIATLTVTTEVDR